MHPARTLSYSELITGLEAAVEEKLVNKKISSDGLWLFNYSNSCVYERAWNIFTLIARGLIVDPVAQKVIATPFPKFFNFGERDEALPDEPFESFEKLDGSMIDLFHHHGWRAATRGSFDSEQAVWAQNWLTQYDLNHLVQGTTYLFEATYPENRIVVRYGESALTLLGAYLENGTEADYEDLLLLGKATGLPVVERHSFSSIEDLVEHSHTLSNNQEGFVVRYASGTRIKIKGAEYRRIHALVSRITPLGVFECMAAGDNLEAMRREIPEEFWADFDKISELLDMRIREILFHVQGEAARFAGQSDKEVGLALSTISPLARPFIFAYRRGDDLQEGRSRQALYKHIRPTGNRLSGYTPSYTLHRVQDDE